MRADATLSLVPIGGPGFSLVGGAGVALPTPALDLLGYGVGVNPSASIIGTQRATFGTDFGIGRYLPHLAIFLAPTPTIATATAATLNVQFQMATDSGAAGGYLPGAWQTVVETGPMTLAQLVAAQTGANAQPIRIDWPPNFPQNLNPRFARINFVPAAATSFTAGLVGSAIITTVRDDYAVRFAQRNYSVA